jgi:hypothetical protein
MTGERKEFKFCGMFKIQTFKLKNRNNAKVYVLTFEFLLINPVEFFFNSSIPFNSWGIAFPF